MKKLTLLFVVMFMVLTMVPAVSANTGDEFVTELTAGGGNPKSAIPVGSVKVLQVDQMLKIKYQTLKGWCLSEVHLHVADSLDGFPQTAKGNPIPGQFAYSMEVDCSRDSGYIKVPLEPEWIEAGTVFIAAHAVVCKCECVDKCLDLKCGCSEECACSGECETAWGGDYFGDPLEFPGNNWAIYFAYSLD